MPFAHFLHLLLNIVKYIYSNTQLREMKRYMHKQDWVQQHHRLNFGILAFTHLKMTPL